MEHLEWEVTEAVYQPERNLYYETNFTLANGYMGLRGLPEEGFFPEEDTYPGAYIAGVYDGFDGDYVELVNCPAYFGVTVSVGGHVFRPEKDNVSGYSRSLNLREGTLTRELVWTDPDGGHTRLYWQRFLSMADVHLACLRVRAEAIDHGSPIRLETSLDGGVYNRRQRDYPPIREIIPNYHWSGTECGASDEGTVWLSARTRTTGIRVFQSARLSLTDGAGLEQRTEGERAEQAAVFDARPGRSMGIDKLVSTYTSRDVPEEAVRAHSLSGLERAAKAGYDALLREHREQWLKRWESADIRIAGDSASQQGIRFNIFHLIQANAPWDPGVNLPAKLLSHTRYKGNAFWDTEMFMFPFYLYTNPEAARTLLLYRYGLLDGARKNAERRGLRGAMYPWCSAHDGSEQCDSWEYGDCEIHITADVAYAFDQYIRVTGDVAMLRDCAAEVYIETARFWCDRVAWNEGRGAYTLLAVKGPDEYCSIANNNMYTNYLAASNLRLAEEAVARMEERYPREWSALKERLRFQPGETARWREVREGMYFNWDHERSLLLQDDAFLDQPELDLSRYAGRKTPVLELIGYERVMRVRILRQADVIHLMYLLGGRFSPEQKRAAFDFYEPLTTHDSSLSYSIHCVMAARLGMTDKAEGYFFKTCRLDLDDEQDTARSGLHGASLGGTWQAVVNGFGGVEVTEAGLSLTPILPAAWAELSFQLHYRSRRVKVCVRRDGTELSLLEGEPLELLLDGAPVRLEKGGRGGSAALH